MSLSYLTRDEWGAVRPLKWNSLTPPVTRIYNIATNTRRCFEELHCIQTCQQLQSLDIRDKHGDIRYSFLIGGDGQVYEGRGWKHAPLLPKEYMNQQQHSSILIGFIGRWYDDKLPDIMVRASSDLIDYGVDNKYISRNFKTKDLFHNEFKEKVFAQIVKESRENKMMKRFKTWKMVKEMGITNEIENELDDVYPPRRDEQ